MQIIEANLNGELNLKIETEIVCVTTHFKDLGNPPVGKFFVILPLINKVFQLRHLTKVEILVCVFPSWGEKTSMSLCNLWLQLERRLPAGL